MKEVNQDQWADYLCDKVVIPTGGPLTLTHIKESSGEILGKVIYAYEGGPSVKYEIKEED